MPSIFFGSFSIFWLLGSAFWFWMLYECVKSGRDGQQWIWLLIFLNIIGAVLYFVTQWLPAHPEFLSKVGGNFGLVSRRDPAIASGRPRPTPKTLANPRSSPRWATFFLISVKQTKPTKLINRR